MKSFNSKSLNAVETYMYGLKSRAHRNHCLGNATFPIDLTELGAVRKRYSKQVQPVTLTPIFIKAVALSVRANPGANRILFQRSPFGRRMVQFDVIDVNVPVTRVVDGERVTFIGVIRGADKLTIAEIQDELAHIQNDPPEQSPYLQKIAKLKRTLPIAVSMYHWLMSRSPRFYLKNAGTCGITLIEGVPGGHFYPIGPTTAIFGIGGTGDQVVAKDRQPTVRRVLQVSLALDNYVLNGIEGLELTMTFQQLLESCSFVMDELREHMEKTVKRLMRQEIAARARLEPDQIMSDAHFLQDLGLSSLDLLSMLAFAEKSFSTRFPDALLPQLTTLDKVADAICNHQGVAVEEQI